MNILIKTTPEWAVNLFPFLNYCLNKFLDLPNWLQQLCNSTSDHVFSYSFVSNPTCHNIKKQSSIIAVDTNINLTVIQPLENKNLE